MQTMQYTVQFLSPPDDRLCSLSPGSDRGTRGLRRSLPSANPIYKLSMTSMVRNISTGQLGLAVWLCSLTAPARLLISWIWETGKSPWFHSNN